MKRYTTIDVDDAGHIRVEDDAGRIVTTLPFFGGERELLLIAQANLAVDFAECVQEWITWADSPDEPDAALRIRTIDKRMRDLLKQAQELGQ